MKLKKVKITNFRSIENSEVFEISDLTCLVGKNEAGKTAILHALNGVNPFRDYKYDKTRDYPRKNLSKFDELHPDGGSIVAKTWWELNEEDLSILRETFGPNAITSNEVVVSSYMGEKVTKTWTVNIDEKQVINWLCEKYGLNGTEKLVIKEAGTSVQAAETLRMHTGITENQKKVLDVIDAYRDREVLKAAIDLLNKRMPKFFYTSHFERMAGEISLTKLNHDKANQRVSTGDRIFMDFLEYAGTSIEELNKATKREELIAKCEGASNEITDEIFEFWSQNEALSVKIDIGEGKSGDEAPFNSGTVVKIRIDNRNHRVSVPLSERSAGFIWFFSFLSQFKQLKKEAGNAILLLDEPGLTLHGKAQSDLLRYIMERLLPDHQVVYTTHSPFMVPANKLAAIRVVEDVVEWKDQRKPIVHGTKVSSDILSVNKDTLFPLQGHLGYEITQSLFIGQNTLLVEGPSDILYLQVLSQALNDKKRTGLDPRWTICPSGGLDKIHSFAALFGGNKLNVAVLTDFAIGDRKKIEQLKQSQILKSSQIFTVADFLDKDEGDIEDILEPEIYSEILNKAYALDGENIVTPEKLSGSQPTTVRIVKQSENLFKLMKGEVPNFDHYAPANWLLRNSSLLMRDEPAMQKTLDTAEKIFKSLNELLFQSAIL